MRTERHSSFYMGSGSHSNCQMPSERRSNFQMRSERYSNFQMRSERQSIFQMRSAKHSKRLYALVTIITERRVGRPNYSRRQVGCREYRRRMTVSSLAAASASRRPHRRARPVHNTSPERSELRGHLYLERPRILR